MPHFGFIDIEGLNHPLAVIVDDTELFERPLYERIQFNWSYDYIMKYTNINEYVMKESKCRPLVRF